jgi:hypothetical protein
LLFLLKPPQKQRKQGIPMAGGWLAATNMRRSPGRNVPRIPGAPRVEFAAQTVPDIAVACQQFEAFYHKYDPKRAGDLKSHCMNLLTNYTMVSTSINIVFEIDLGSSSR